MRTYNLKNIGYIDLINLYNAPCGCITSLQFLELEKNILVMEKNIYKKTKKEIINLP